MTVLDITREMLCTLKYASLLFITIQTSVLVLSMRMSRLTEESNLYLISTVVLCAEVLKLILSLTYVIIEEGFNLKSALELISDQVFLNFSDTIKVLLPSALYVMQNNLLYIAISRLNAVVYQVLYQTKLLTTAMFMVLILQKNLRLYQWIALLLLCAGIILTQLSTSPTSTSESRETVQSSSLIGFFAILIASFSSGFAGVYFEKILKGTAPSIWIRNIQLALFGIPLSLFGVIAYDFDNIKNQGFFHGYSMLVWFVVLLQAFGGIGVAFVMKYADNILKGFATGLSILLSTVISYFVLNDFSPTILIFLGAVFVIAAVMLYGFVPPPDVKCSSELNESTKSATNV